MSISKVVNKGTVALAIALFTFAIFSASQRFAHAEPLGSDIVCHVFSTLTELGDPISPMDGGDCPGEPPQPPPPSPLPACSDGTDNDHDGLTDSADPGCSSASDTDESNTLEEDAKLIVVKKVVNDDGGTKTASNFSLHAKKTLPDSQEAVGVSSGATTTVSVGTWVVGEIPDSAYTASFSGDCDASGEVTIGAGESKTCIVTNNDIAASASACSDGLDNDGDNLTDSADPGCVNTSDNDESNPTGSGGNNGSSGSSGGGGGGGSSLSPATTTGIVLGFSTTTESCDRYLTAFIREGNENDVDQVKRLQRFLRDFEAASVTETGTYDAPTVAAVHAFQTNYAPDILAPWGIGKSTGYVYLTTRKKVNEIFCRNTKTFFLTNDELKKIEETRAAAIVSVSVPTAPKPSVPAQPKMPVTPSPATSQSGAAAIDTSPLSNIFEFLRGIWGQYGQ